MDKNVRAPLRPKLDLLSRRHFLAKAAAAGMGFASAATQPFPVAAAEDSSPKNQAQIAITFDLEMARNFPTWGQTHWDYEKGNLTAAVKRYAVEAARRVKARGGRIHFFVVGRVFEQENLDWLKEIVREGHPVGNHTYDHVYVLATRLSEIQYRFTRAPWLIQGKKPAEIIEENIRLTTLALKERIGIAPAGFRTPGGFAEGLSGRLDVQQMLLDLGFKWVSGKYPAHPVGPLEQEPTAEILDAIVQAQAAAQPFVYPSGLIEVPMSPISDIGAFRNGRWQLDWFLTATRRAVESVIEQGKVFDFLAHPSCLGVVDREFRAIEMICDLVQKAGNGAALVDLETIARRVKHPG